MDITFDENKQIIHIKNQEISYVIEIVNRKYPVHRYFGRALRQYRGMGIPRYFKRGYATEHNICAEHAAFDDVPFEYPIRGNGDFRIPAISVIRDDGIAFADPVFSSFSIKNGSPDIPGLPAVTVPEESAKSLEIICEDRTAGLRVILSYTVVAETGIMLRHQRIENIGERTLWIQNAQSLSLELPAGPYDFLSMYGTHAKEANRDRFRLHHGIQRIESVRRSSSPQHQPFFALISPDTSEEKGVVFAFHLVYSGNFLAQAAFAEKERPVLLNSWEAMYYDVSLEKISRQASLAKELGMELFVLDDGWFRTGNDSRSPIGDWICNERKLPGGIRRTASIVHDKKLLFGLWFEPEAVSRNSRLYENHPDWVLHIPGYPLTEGRHECLLDLTREDVRTYLKKMLDSYLKDGDIDYIKWDMNRPLTEVNSALLTAEEKGETSHRYILGLYEILQWLKDTYPNVLIEGCSSGGARFDPGMLYYVSQNWASDNTDAFDRTRIQSGFSMLYPPEVIGAHVSITPNHQTGRVTPLDTRYQTARLFNLGYELDLTKCSEEEKAEIRLQVLEHIEERSRFLNAAFYRHDVPNENYVMWSVVTERECIAVLFQKFFNPLYSRGRFRLLGLDPEGDYADAESGEVYGGDELMRIGVTVPLIKEDFHVFSFHFKKVSFRKGR